jgi:hypothetical protein
LGVPPLEEVVVLGVAVLVVEVVGFPAADVVVVTPLEPEDQRWIASKIYHSINLVPSSEIESRLTKLGARKLDPLDPEATEMVIYFSLSKFNCSFPPRRLTVFAPETNFEIEKS